MFKGIGQIAGLMGQLPRNLRGGDGTLPAAAAAAAPPRATPAPAWSRSASTAGWKCIACVLSDEAFKAGDREMLEDLIRAAVNQAIAKVRQLIAEETRKMAVQPRPAAGDGFARRARAELVMSVPTSLCRGRSPGGVVDVDTRAGRSHRRSDAGAGQAAGHRPEDGRTPDASPARRPSAPTVLALADALRAVKESIRPCRQCCNLTEGDLCASAPTRAAMRRCMCVVEQPRDLAALERSATYRGLYHVLHGRLAPLDGVGPEQLTIDSPAAARASRAACGRSSWRPTRPWKATARRCTSPACWPGTGVRVTRLARGLPSGSVLEFANSQMLADALEGRRTF